MTQVKSGSLVRSITAMAVTWCPMTGIIGCDVKVGELFLVLGQTNVYTHVIDETGKTALVGRAICLEPV